jgi:diaminopimelate epimerase
MRLTKHHGIGNDFLVLVDLAGDQPLDPDAVRAWCDRHRGVGADGVLRARPGGDGADIGMDLYNADGSRAEMSGNGIGCLVQAVLLDRGGLAPSVVVDTDAGRRTVAVAAASAPDAIHATVDMGDVTIVGDAPEWTDGDVARAVRVDVGNPHLVLMAADAAWSPDIAELGRAVNDKEPAGVNVEVVVAGAARDELDMQVYERGVGVTLACGTGAVAAAVAAGAWGLVGPAVTVHMAGGDAHVDVGDRVRYGVDIHHIATIEVPDSWR